MVLCACKKKKKKKSKRTHIELKDLCLYEHSDVSHGEFVTLECELYSAKTGQCT